MKWVYTVQFSMNVPELLILLVSHNFPSFIVSNKELYKAIYQDINSTEPYRSFIAQIQDGLQHLPHQRYDLPKEHHHPTLSCQFAYLNIQPCTLCHTHCYVLSNIICPSMFHTLYLSHFYALATVRDAT